MKLNSRDKTLQKDEDQSKFYRTPDRRSARVVMNRLPVALNQST